MTKTVLSIGEATLDSFMFLSDANVHCTLDKKRCEFCVRYADKMVADNSEWSVGGNAANTAVTFARFGHQSQLFSVIGDDWMGQQIHTVLEEEKIECEYIQHKKGPSSYATALIFQGERTLVIYHVPREYHLPKFKPVDWVYLTSMGRAYMTAYQDVLHFVKSHKIKMSFNPGTYQLKAGVTALKPFLAITECLFVNTDEAFLLTERPPSATIRELSEALYDYGPKIVNITDGQEGAYMFDGERLLHCKIFPGPVVERTGAGDSYSSAFTAALLHGETLEEAMRWGMANAAGVVSQIGPEKGILTKAQLHRELIANNHIHPTKV